MYSTRILLSMYVQYSILNSSAAWVMYVGSTVVGVRISKIFVYTVCTFIYLIHNSMQGLVGAIGFLANTLAVPVLCSREMNSIFNRLLVFLSLWDNLYIICSVLEGIRKHTPFSQVM